MPDRQQCLRDLGCSEVLCSRLVIGWKFTPQRVQISRTKKSQKSLRINDERAQKTIWRHFIARENAECARHLFRVAAGLDSMVVAKPKSLARPSALMLTRVRVKCRAVASSTVSASFSGGKTMRSKTQITRGRFRWVRGSRFGGEDFW